MLFGRLVVYAVVGRLPSGQLVGVVVVTAAPGGRSAQPAVAGDSRFGVGLEVSGVMHVI